MRHAARARVPFLLLVGITLPPLAAPAWGVERKELDQFEERVLQRWVERAAKGLRSERARLQKELENAYPGKVVSATTEQDFASWFDLLAGRNDQWWRDDTPGSPLADLFDKAVQRLELGPVPSMTREEFCRYAKRVLREQLPPPAGKEPNSDEDADKVFRVLDRNGDGELDELEVTTDLRENRILIEDDGDGRISKIEYRASFQRRAVGKAEAQLAKSLEAARPPGDMPPSKPRPGVPDWFPRLDADTDGQLSLYECRTGGGSIALFTEMDLNGDGFLTREEFRRYAKLNEEKYNPKAREKR